MNFHKKILKMQKVILVSVCTIFLVASGDIKSFGQSSQPQINTLNQTDNKTINLFNGRNLDGWYTFLQNRGRDVDPKGVFTVIDGMIRIPSPTREAAQAAAYSPSCGSKGRGRLATASAWRAGSPASLRAMAAAASGASAPISPCNRAASMVRVVPPIARVV